MVSGGDPFYLKFWVNRPPMHTDGTDLDDLEWPWTP